MFVKVPGSHGTGIPTPPGQYNPIGQGLAGGLGTSVPSGQKNPGSQSPTGADKPEIKQDKNISSK